MYRARQSGNVATGALFLAVIAATSPNASHANDGLSSAATLALRAARAVTELTQPLEIAQSQAGSESRMHRIPVFASASDSNRQGFARIINHSDEAGEVQIDAWDDAGTHRGPLTLSIGAGRTEHFNSDHLEGGEAHARLSGSTGAGEGSWRLELTSTLDLEVLSYMRTDDGFLTSMHDRVARNAAGVYRVAIFNPARNVGQVSRLRLVNSGAGAAQVTIEGIDGNGTGSGGTVTVSVPARASRTLTAQKLESGDAGFAGALGTGAGKWQLLVRSDADIEVMSLLSSPTRHLTNLSTSTGNGAPGTHRIPVFASASDPNRQGFARIINHSDEAGEVQIDAWDDAGTHRGPLTLSIGAGRTEHFNSDHLEGGEAHARLSGSTGAGEGSWRLELTSTLDLEVLSYMRTDDGFLTSMHDRVARNAAGVYRVAIFNPARNVGQVSRLRLVNSGAGAAQVTIEGIDGNGTGSGGTVTVSVPARASRTLTAQKLESGDAGFAGALGTGAGKWQLLVRSDADIEVMSLLSSPTDHLTNLSTASRVAVDADGFDIAADGSTTVRPMQVIALTVSQGLGESDYAVQIDLSGTGAFDAAATVEVEGLTTDREQIVFAAPLTQLVPDTNTSHGLAVRARRSMDGRLSNVLRFSIEDIALPADLPGYPTVLLEVILKSIYITADDPLLSVEGASIQPGLLVASAQELGLDVTFSDAQAAAMLRSMFGITDLLPAQAASASTGPMGMQGTAPAGQILEDPFGPLLQCVRRGFDALTNNTDYDLAAHDRCTRIGTLKLFKAQINNLAPAVGVSLSSRIVQTVVNNVATKVAVDTLNHVVSWGNNVVRSSKLLRLFGDGSTGGGNRHFVQDVNAGPVPTTVGQTANYRGMVDFTDEAATVQSNLVADVESDYAGRSIGEDDRAALANIVNESDRQQRDAESIEELEDVYTRRENVVDALKPDPTPGQAVGSCAAGYQEFPIDDKTSSCVFASLVEPNCYPGSRPVQEPDLGTSDACLYYSLDWFQSGETCRDNYAKVVFQGRTTCRWADLGLEQAAWYTLEKEHGIRNPQAPVVSDDDDDDDDDQITECDEIPEDLAIYGVSVTCTVHTEQGTVAEVTARYLAQGYVRLEDTEVYQYVFREFGLPAKPGGDCQLLVDSSYDSVLSGGDWNGRGAMICPNDDGTVTVVVTQIHF